jgi:hypothetical protein
MSSATPTLLPPSSRSLLLFTGALSFDLLGSYYSFVWISVFKRMRANSSAATIQRFVNAADLYTQAILQQTMNRSVDDVPTIEEFIQLRRDTSAVKMVFCKLF